MNTKLKSFAAIDFETANYERSSVCSVGIVAVKNDCVVQKYTLLIKPIPNYYIDDFIGIHGITWQDTKNARLFPAVLAEVVPIIGDLPLVAHNVAFDGSCLREVFGAYGMEYPEYAFYCTLNAARKKLPQLPNHQLQTVAAFCGCNMTNHHDALADAEACAAIALQIL